MKLKKFLYLIIEYEESGEKSLGKYEIPNGLEHTCKSLTTQLESLNLIPSSKTQLDEDKEPVYFHDTEAEEHEWKFLNNIEITQLRCGDGDMLLNSGNSVGYFSNQETFFKKIKALLVITSKNEYIGFQRKNANTVFHNKPIISFFRNKGFSEERVNQIVLSDEFDMIYCPSAKRLYFRSFFIANSFFNLDEHAPLIDKERFNKLFTEDLFVIDNRDSLFDKLKKRTKKKMAVIEHNNHEHDSLLHVLRNDDGTKWKSLKSYAKKHGLSDCIDSDNRKISFPKSDSEVLKLCQVIDEDFYTGHYSKNSYLSRRKNLNKK